MLTAALRPDRPPERPGYMGVSRRLRTDVCCPHQARLTGQPGGPRSLGDSAKECTEDFGPTVSEILRDLHEVDSRGMDDRHPIEPFGAATFGAVVDSDLVVGTAESPELRFYGDDGSLHRIVRWPDHERRVTEGRIDEYMAAAEASLPEEARSQARAVLSKMPRSDHLPAFEDVLASPDGELWVGAYRGPEMALPGARSPSREWLVFDHDGQLEAKVTTPEGFQPLYVGSGEVIGVYVDDLGVESIRVYEVLE